MMWHALQGSYLSASNPRVMHRSLLLLGIVPFLLLSSCKKEDPVEPTPAPDPAPTQFDLSLNGDEARVDFVMGYFEFF